ncbi:hypothetical protein [Streptomyces sp. ISL-11]|uniref:hypothetical protein n=1 Tax=Streptomyces sp. ISL-11 TaxID=2819174 RepID=UPI001BEA4675|nr:hypothetical protein [Streptomyces sp. ISL-11]MBT2385231.1 hypothetical protein [Streptomyces sp. ISL-11]
MGSGDPGKNEGDGGKPSGLNVPSESLQEFKKRVDRLLDKLDGSAASHTQITQQKVKQSAYGSSVFTEATDLASAYDTVHARLEAFSRILGDQLEAMGTAVSMADGDYEHVDKEHADRLYAIQKRAEEYWKQQQERGGSFEDKKKPGGGSTGGSGGSVNR